MERRPTARRLTQHRFASPFIMVKVGTPPTTFHVQQEHLANASDFFANALERDWDKDQQRALELPEQDPATFNIYLNWLFCRRISLSSAEHEDVCSKSIGRIILAYALGDALLDSDFKDAVSDALILECTTLQDDQYWVPHLEDRKILYWSTRRGSKLRSILVHMVALHDVEVISDEEPHELLLDLTRLKMNGTEKKTPGKMVEAVANCEFHEHERGFENCYRAKYAQAAVHSIGGHHC